MLDAQKSAGLAERVLEELGDLSKQRNTVARR